LFVLVTLLLPKGIVGTFSALRQPFMARPATIDVQSAAREDGVSEPNMAE